MATRRNRGGAGQKRWSEGEARAAMAAWEESGLSGATFARTKGIDSQRLFWWRSRFAREAATRPAFLPVIAKPSPERASAALIVTTSRGSRIEVCEVDAATAAWVAAVLVGETGP